MDDAITRATQGAALQTPVAYLNCNFSAPVGGKPALFTHDEVITLFHEFGHGLHHLLTRVDVPAFPASTASNGTPSSCPASSWRISAGNGTCSQPMTRHVDTGAPLPRELFDKMLAAKNFQSGMQTVRQIEFALFDMHLHYEFDPRRRARRRMRSAGNDVRDAGRRR